MGRAAAGTDAPPDEALRLVDVRKVYGRRGNEVTALAGVSLTLRRGTFTAVMGPSGSGKSTLLQCAAGLEELTGGEVRLAGVPLPRKGGETALTKFRRDRVAFVFQHLNLLPTLTVEQNVTLPLRLAGRRVDPARVAEVLTRVGLGDRLDRRPAELSGGQQQRVAIARALVAEPPLVFADEPTGALDTRTAREVLGLLGETVRRYGRTLVMVTHDPVAASYADTVVFLADGRVAGELPAPTPDAVAERMTHLGETNGSAAAAGRSSW
jgi:putative ABC transport system ATP-binding protein